MGAPKQVRYDPNKRGQQMGMGPELGSRPLPIMIYRVGLAGSRLPVTGKSLTTQAR